MKILFITSGSIGDAVMATGLMGHLLDTYPLAHFTVAVGPAAAPLFEAMPRLDRLIVIRKQPWNRHWLALWNNVRKEHWDLVVDLRGSALSFLIRTRARKIFHHYDKSQSKAEQLAALFDLPTPPATRLWSNEKARNNARALLPEKPFIVIAPLTNSAAKDWPIERFAELAHEITKEKTVCVVLATKEQQPSIQPIVQALPAAQVKDLCGQADLLTAYAILEQAQLFIGNDSGLLHMAAAANIPCVGIYGPTNDKIYAPRGAHIKIVKAREFAAGEEEKRDNSFMRQISVTQVKTACYTLLKERATSSAA